MIDKIFLNKSIFNIKCPKNFGQNKTITENSIERVPVKDEVHFEKHNSNQNTITMIQDEGKMNYSFYENGKRIGHIIINTNEITEAQKGEVPDDWFEEIPNENEIGKLKPNIFLSDFVIEDRVGLTGDYQQRKNGKKYGTMCLQKVLEWAENNGYENRISLCPGKTHSDIDPAIFYAKLGFELSPTILDIVKKSSRYTQIDGRYVSKGQDIYLTNPEILRNYPLN